MAESLLAALTEPEQRFVEEFCKDRNQVRAALAAGLSDSYFAAAQQARTLLKNPQIRTAVRRVFAVQARRLKTAAPDIVREWAAIATADLTDYEVGPGGRLTVAPGVPLFALRAVKKFKQTRTVRTTHRGGELEEEVRTEIELHDKLGALAKLYDHLHGALPAEQDKAGVNVELAARLAALLAARQPQPGGGGVPPGGAAVAAEPGAAGGGVPQPGG